VILPIFRSVAFFLLAGVLEIGGGYFVWLCLREGRPAWMAVLGAWALAGYGVVATLQQANFGRVYAAYGGVFIALSLAWDGESTVTDRTAGISWAGRCACSGWPSSCTAPGQADSGWSAATAGRLVAAASRGCGAKRRAAAKPGLLGNDRENQLASPSCRMPMGAVAGAQDLLFAFFLSEAMVTGCCDGDLAQASVVGTAVTSGQSPVDGAPLPASAHVCQCAHTTSVFRTAPPRTALMLDHRVPTYPVTPPRPFSLQSDHELEPVEPAAFGHVWEPFQVPLGAAKPTLADRPSQSVEMVLRQGERGPRRSAELVTLEVFPVRPFTRA
jgi:drug/metabolite transporter superfamily protein YnfA